MTMTLLRIDEQHRLNRCNLSQCHLSPCNLSHQKSHSRMMLAKELAWRPRVRAIALRQRQIHLAFRCTHGLVGAGFQLQDACSLDPLHPCSRCTCRKSIQSCQHAIGRPSLACWLVRLRRDELGPDTVWFGRYQALPRFLRAFLRVCEVVSHPWRGEPAMQALIACHPCLPLYTAQTSAHIPLGRAAI